MSEEINRAVLEKKIKHLTNELRLTRKEYEVTAEKYFDIYSNLDNLVKQRTEDLRKEVEYRRKTEDALRRRDAILEAVNYTSTWFLSKPKWQDNAKNFLEHLGHATHATSSYILCNRYHRKRLVWSQCFHWSELGEDSETPFSQPIDAEQFGFAEIISELGQRKVIHLEIEKLQDPLFSFLRDDDSRRSLILAPIFVERIWWGLIGFDFKLPPPFGPTELDALKTATDILGAAVKREEIEEELAKKQAQLAHSSRLAALGEMSTAIAHEINQPLQIIRTSSDIVSQEIEEAGLENSIIPSVLITLNTQVQRAAGIISNIRTFARQDDRFHLSLMDPVELILNAVSFFNEQFRIHEIDFSLDLEEDLPNAFIHPQKFEQVVVNLLSNAHYSVEKKFRDSTGKSIKIRAYRFQPEIEKRKTSSEAVKLWLKEHERGIVVEVMDNGIGMSPAIQAKCLEPFFTTKPVGVGTGLGLSISYGIIKEFEGEIDIDSVENEKTAFKIFIPVKSGEPKNAE